MNRDEMDGLYYIVSINNIPSIMRMGILSHNRAQRIGHDNIALQEVQDIRANRRLQTGRWLHDYANLYICARNPMMYRRRNLHADLCVLKISLDVLDINGAVVSDRNASSNYAAFYPSPAGLAYIDGELVFSEYWTHPNQFEQFRRRSIKCAEVLIPDRINSAYIIGAHVSCRESAERLSRQGFRGTIIIDERMFFL